MTREDIRACAICGGVVERSAPPSLLADTGAWASAELCSDDGEICLRCRESRAILALMYVVDR
ncbi:MAG: hypothetical protein Fur0034_14990 [Desulfuromonadia bacterium]